MLTVDRKHDERQTRCRVRDLSTRPQHQLTELRADLPDAKIGANHSAGALDIRYADTWEQMSAVAQWWAAASGGVGPAPSLAPGVLAFTAAALLAATLHHMEEASP